MDYNPALALLWCSSHSNIRLMGVSSCCFCPYHFLSISSLFNMIFHVHLVLCLPQPWNQAFLQDTLVHCRWELYLETKICVLHMCMTVGVSPLKPPSRYAWGICVRISMYRYICFPIHLYTYHTTYFQANTTGLIPAFFPFHIYNPLLPLWEI